MSGRPSTAAGRKAKTWRASAPTQDRSNGAGVWVAGPVGAAFLPGSAGVRSAEAPTATPTSRATRAKRFRRELASRGERSFARNMRTLLSKVPGDEKKLLTGQGEGR